MLLWRLRRFWKHDGLRRPRSAHTSSGSAVRVLYGVWMNQERRRFLRACCMGAALVLPALPSVAESAISRFDNAEVMVHNFLRLHFGGAREFNATGLESKRRFLTPRFRSTLYRFLTERARSRSPTSSPPMVA